ncbi:MAG: ABC transporter permease [Acidobacteriota bacterium]|nr:ABC transporter permease [Acidobacteriota bacterium]
MEIAQKTEERADRTQAAASLRPRLSAGDVLFRLRAAIVLAVISIAFAAAAPNFLSPANLTILVKHVAINAILAVGMTFVILSGGIDLSVGSVVGFAGIVAGKLIHDGLVLRSLGDVVYFHTWLVVAVAVASGALVGALNGVLVANLRVPPFIATLGTLYMARGAAMLLSNGATFPQLGGRADLGNTGFPWIGAGTVLSVPVPIWIMAAIAGIGAAIAGKTPFGRRVYAVGGNERAAELSGVRVPHIKFAVYVMSGLCAAIVGLIIAGELAAAHPATGETFELNAIAAVVLGGTSLMGGRGSVGGTIIGAFVIGVLADGLVLLGVSEFWQMVIKGFVIVAAVLLDQMQQKYGRRRFAAQRK